MLAAFSGIAFGLIGIAYRLGQKNGVRPEHIAVVFSIGGALFFGGRIEHAAGLDPHAAAWGCVVGSCQFFLVVLIGATLKRGPLSPIWCSIGLGFIPSIVYALVFLGEHVSALQTGGVTAGIGAVLAGSFRQSGETADTAPEPSLNSWKNSVFYGWLLVLILLVNGMSGVALKSLSVNESPDFNLFFLALYSSLGLLTALRITVKKMFPDTVKKMLMIGGMACAGSISGMWAFGQCATLNAAALFTTSGIVSLLTATVASVLFFKERAGLTWFVMVTLAITSIIAVNFG